MVKVDAQPLALETTHPSALRYLKSKYRRSDMKNKIVSHLKFTVKDGCVDDFLLRAQKLIVIRYSQPCAHSQYSQKTMYLWSLTFMMTLIRLCLTR